MLAAAFALLGWGLARGPLRFVLGRRLWAVGCAIGCATCLFLLIGFSASEDKDSADDSQTVLTVNQTEEIAWINDEKEALVRARAERKPIMLEFTAEWCAPCQQLKQETYKDPTVIAESRHLIALLIDVTKIDDLETVQLMEKYKVLGLPTIHFLNSDGTLIRGNSVTGFLNPDEFLLHMKTALNKD